MILWRRKVWNGRSKGISTVLGTVFLTLVIFAISTNVFLWTLSRNAEYTLAVKEENQKTADRLNEYVIASGTNYSVVTGEEEVRIKVTLKNAGSLAVQLINIWVFDTTQQTYANEPVNVSLNPGQAMPYSLNVGLSASNTSDFVSWFVTARGNTVPLEAGQEIIVAQLAQGIGSIGMSFPDFRSYNVSQAGPLFQLEPYPGGSEGYTVPLGQDIAFRASLTNFDESKQDLTLFSPSALWMLFPATAEQPRGAWWYIVNVDDAGTIAAAFTPITLKWGLRTEVFFASATDGVFNPSSIDPPTKPDQPASINLMLIGEIGNSAYGQNIPFVSIYITG